MINFKNLECEDSAIIYYTTLEQIKKLYIKNPMQAGELAIAAIEVALSGGQHSSDDDLIDLILEQNKFLSTKNIQSKHRKIDAQNEKRINDLKLREILELLAQGFNQTQIGVKFGVSKQTISKRVNIIYKDYPWLLPEAMRVNLGSTSQPKSIDDNQIQLMSTGQPKIVDIVDDNQNKLTLVDEVDDLTTEVDSQPKNSGHFDNQVNQVNPNDNVNVNDNVNTRPSSNEEALDTISLSELNRMGATYTKLGGGVIEFPTGKRMKIEYDF